MNLERSALIGRSAGSSAAVLQGECLPRNPPGHFTASCAFTFAIDYCLCKGGRVFTRAHLLIGVFVCQQDYGESDKWISTKLSGKAARKGQERSDGKFGSGLEGEADFSRNLFSYLTLTVI